MKVLRVTDQMLLCNMILKFLYPYHYYSYITYEQNSLNSYQVDISGS